MTKRSRSGPELVPTLNGSPFPPGDGELVPGEDGLLCEVAGVSLYLESGTCHNGRRVAYPVGKLPEDATEREVLGACWGVLARYGVESVSTTGLIRGPDGGDRWVRVDSTSERVYLGREAQVEIRAKVELATAEFIRGIPGFVQGVLSSSVASLLGLKKEYGKWEVDRSGSKESSSPIGKCIGEAVHREVVKQFEPVVLVLLKKVAEDVKYQEAVAKEARELYRRRLREAVLKEAEERARVDAVAYVEEFKKFRLQSLIPITELEHPRAYEGVIGELVLESLVEGEIGPGLLSSSSAAGSSPGGGEEDP